MAIHCSVRLRPGTAAMLAIAVLAISTLLPAVLVSAEGEDDRHYHMGAGCSGSTASSFGIKVTCTPQRVSFFDADKKSSGRIGLDKFVVKLKKASGRPYGLMIGKSSSGGADVEQGFRIFNVSYDSAAKTIDLDIVHVAGTWPGSKGIVLKPVTLKRLDLYFHPLKFAKFVPAAAPENPFNQTVLTGPEGTSSLGKRSGTAQGAGPAAAGRKLQQGAGPAAAGSSSGTAAAAAGRRLQQHAGRKLQQGGGSSDDIWVTSPLTIFHAHVHKGAKVGIKCASVDPEALAKCTITVESGKAKKESTLMASDKPIWAKHAVRKYVSTYRQSYSVNQDVVGLAKLIPLSGAGAGQCVFGFNLLDMTYTAGASTGVATYSIELHGKGPEPSSSLPSCFSGFSKPAAASLFMFQSNPKTKVQANSRSASTAATPAFDAGTDCATVSELSSSECAANYLGTGFNVLSAFPYPGVSQPPGSDSENGVSLAPSSTAQSDYMFNNQIFTYASLAANKREGATSCSGTMEVQTHQDTSDVRTSLAVSASVSVEYWGVTGTASVNYQTDSETVSSGSYSMTTATVACQMASYNLPIDMGLYELSASFIKHAQVIVEESYSTDSLYSLYRAYGSHWVDSVVLGGTTTATIISTSKSVSQQDNEDISVSATIENSFAKASGDVSYNSASKYTADDLGWSWKAEQSPSGAGLKYGDNGAPDMTDYFNSLNDPETVGAYKWVPLSYTVSDIVSTVFDESNYDFLWANSNLTRDEVVTIGTRYYLFVKQCAPGVTAAALTCELETDSSTCGSFSYSVYGEPLDNSTKTPSCSSCLEGINRNFSSVDAGACPWFSSGCPAATPSGTGLPPYACKPPASSIWSVGSASIAAQFPNFGGVTGVYDNCLYVAEYSLTAKACLSSPGSGQYQLCLNGRGQIGVVDTGGSSGPQTLLEISATLNRASGGYWACVASGGNLLAYNPVIGVYWQSYTGDVGTSGNSCFGAGKPYWLVMQADANAVIYDKSYNPLWASNTAGPTVSQGASKNCVNCKAAACP